VFEPFEQAAPEAHTAAGHGLGLAISRQYARLMGGDITVQSDWASAAASGSRFRRGNGDAALLDRKTHTRRVTGLSPGQEAMPRAGRRRRAREREVLTAR